MARDLDLALKHAPLRDRFGELRDRLFLELDARLLRIRLNAADLDFTHAG